MMKDVQPYYVGHMLMEVTVLDEVSEDWLGLPDGEELVRLFQRLIGQQRLCAYAPTQGVRRLAKVVPPTWGFTLNSGDTVQVTAQRVGLAPPTLR